MDPKTSAPTDYVDLFFLLQICYRCKRGYLVMQICISCASQLISTKIWAIARASYLPSGTSPRHAWLPRAIAHRCRPPWTHFSTLQPPKPLRRWWPPCLSPVPPMRPPWWLPHITCWICSPSSRCRRRTGAAGEKETAATKPCGGGSKQPPRDPAVASSQNEEDEGGRGGCCCFFAAAAGSSCLVCTSFVTGDAVDNKIVEQLLCGWWILHHLLEH